VHPVIKEIARWQVGAPVRVAVQRRWQQELLAIDQELTQLREQMTEMAKAKPTPPTNGADAKKAGGAR
jgi:hypothetical protein